MDAAASAVADPTRPASDERLLALGIAMLGWLACAGVLEMLRVEGGGVAGDRGLAARLGHLLVPLVAGLLCQCSASSLPLGSRVRRAAGLWASWTVLGFAALALPARLGLSDPWTAIDLVLQQAGVVLGIFCGWTGGAPLARRLARVAERCEAITPGLVAASSVAIVLLPLVPGALLVDPASGWHIHSPEGYVKALPGQLYLMLKSVILWVPLGMLYAIAQKQLSLRQWAIAGVLAFLLAGLPLLAGTLAVRDAVEILAAYWGIAIGIGLGVEVCRTLPGTEHERVEVSVAPIAMRQAGTSRNHVGAEPTSAEPTSPEQSSAEQSSGEARPGHWTAALPRRAAAVLLLLGVGAWSWFFPRWAPLVLGGLGLYAVLLWRYRQAWLLVVTAALPLLNLAPGTGRIFFDEFDLLMVTTVAMAVWHGAVPGPRVTVPRMLATGLALFGISMAVSVFVGLVPLAPIDANAFTNYWSHYNSLHIAKGFLWMLPVLALLLWTVPAAPDRVMRMFVPGMWLGLAGVIAVGLWERALFAGLFDLSTRYRITATFASMHTGGSEIETYVVTAIPFVWLALGRERPALVRFAGLWLLVAGAYLMTLTIARAGVLAFGVATCVLLFGMWRASRHPAAGKRATIVAGLALAGGAAALAFGLSGGYLQARLAHSEEDWGVRVNHWRKALAMRDDHWTTQAFGMGVGRFPETYLYRSGNAVPSGTYRFSIEGGNPYLSLGGGETLYMAQRVAVAGGRHYTLSLRVRSSDANARLGVPICEKHLLDSRRCQWQVLGIPADGQWHTQSIGIDSGPVGTGDWLTRPPVELSLYNETERTRIDVDDVQLQDDSGKSLIRNGDFSAWADYWFFKTHSHLPWHVKNLWVEILFEQGWFGLLGFTLLLAALLTHLARAVWRGNGHATVLLASAGGFLTVGLFGSLFDAPRMALLFFLLVVLAITVTPPNADPGNRSA